MGRISLITVLKNHPFWGTLGILLFGAGVFLLAYLPVRYGAAFYAARTILSRSPYVLSMVGPRPKISLQLWGGSREVLVLGGSGNSTANMRVFIHGPYGSMTLRLRMEKIDGAWKIESAQRDGKDILLGSSTGRTGSS